MQQIVQPRAVYTHPLCDFCQVGLIFERVKKVTFLKLLTRDFKRRLVNVIAGP